MDFEINHDHDHVGVGLSNPKLSQARRKMLDLVNRLHSTGVQVDIDLPQIAVIGSQSAGKSSLIESISGITLPRAAGTCTRCPTECRLSRSDNPWQCIVLLRFITDAQGQPLGQARNEKFGETIFDKNEVEDRIRRAQRAILNPKSATQYFLDHDDEGAQDSQLSFSSNCVCLQISGPDVADLSFVDLPGLIASVSSHNKGGGNDIALVESLVKTYIKKPNCIILLTVTCETDFENQGAHRLTKQHDPEGKRTIGVLTKPDRIPTGEEANWLPFIRNEKEALENNWFCVKQPSSNDLRSIKSWAQARQMENEFFADNSPWSELDAVYQKYLRTSNLVERLSLVLSDLISKRLPQIFDELEQTITSTWCALDALPKAPSDNPQSEISTLLHDFVTDLRQHVEGVPSSDGLLQIIRPDQETFRRTLRTTAPNFRPFERKYRKERHIRPAKFLVEEEGGVEEDEVSDEEEEESSPSQAPASFPFPNSNTPQKSGPFTIITEHPGPFSLSAGKTARSAQATPHIPSKPSTRQRSSGSGKPPKRGKVDKIYIDEVRERAEEARTRELPGHYPFVVQSGYIKAFIKEWKRPSMVLCQAVHHTITEHVKKLISKHFAFYGQGYLEQRVRTILHQHIEKCRAQTEEKIKWVLDIEESPFSSNTHYLSDYKTKFLTYYRAERQRYKNSLVAGLYTNGEGLLSENLGPKTMDAVARVIAGLGELGITGINPEDLQKLLPDDQMEPALIIMSDVRAYFQVAFKRFADIIPLAIDRELVRGVERGVLKELYTHLGINGPEGNEISKELAQESPQVADKRADLRKKLERLETAQQELLGMSV